MSADFADRAELDRACARVFDNAQLLMQALVEGQHGRIDQAFMDVCTKYLIALQFIERNDLIADFNAVQTAIIQRINELGGPKAV